MNTQHLNPTLPTPALCGAIPAKMLAHGFAAHLIQRPNRLIQLAESWFSSALMRKGNSFTASVPAAEPAHPIGQRIRRRSIVALRRTSLGLRPNPRRERAS
jgi:hypothetical protein